MRKLLTLSLFLVAVTLFAGQTKQESQKEFVMDKVEKSDQEWETCLTPEEYQILREKGTELAFTGEYYKHKEKGLMYVPHVGMTYSAQIPNMTPVPVGPHFLMHWIKPRSIQNRISVMAWFGLKLPVQSVIPI